jgi:hypothetical protein
MAVYANSGYFVFDSNVLGGTYGFYTGGTPYSVVKNSTIARSNPVQHTIRHQGGDRALFQNNNIHGPGNYTSLTVRGITNWVLVQDNFMDQASQVAPEYEDAPGPQLQQYIVWERNVLDGNNALNWGMQFVGHNMIVRNNVVYDGAWSFQARAISPISPQNIWFINNTGINADEAGVDCLGTGCVSKNNLFYSTSTSLACFTNGTQANNWCRTANHCLDPVDGDSDCHDPNFVSLDPTSDNFARPGVGSRGIDAGEQAVPVWQDLNTTQRTMIDVGAVER